MEPNPPKDSSSEVVWGITNEDRSRFEVPKTRNPLSLSNPKNWTTLQWLQNVAVLNVLLLVLPIPGWVFVVWFAFWRLAYNLGIGYLLHSQSERFMLTKWVASLPKDSTILNLIRKEFNKEMGPDYDFDKAPAAFNAWLLFRWIVDVVLANDLATYMVMGLKFWQIPEPFSLWLILYYVVGLGLCTFALWAKIDAFRVVGDFAWYWGDFFFVIEKSLTFDGVFGVSPHPMYTIGYSFYYGTALITQSYTVFYVSLFAHLCQLAFLSKVENPHIEKTYPSTVVDPSVEQKDLYDAGYFRRDLIVFKNFDPFRAADLFQAVAVLQFFVIALFVGIPTWFAVFQVIFFRMAHSFGLGLVLQLQSSSRFFTNHFEARNESLQTAFDHWKQIYNFSVVIQHVVFAMAALHFFSWEFADWALVRITVGFCLIALNIWSSLSTYEVLGDYGWFFGDFFLTEKTSPIYYSGIYRFLNNPDSVTGFAAYYGLAIISDSGVMWSLAFFCHACHMLFVHYVERPHMAALYGQTMRKKSGIELSVMELIEKHEKARKVRDKIKEQTAKISKAAEPFREKIQEHLDNFAEKVEPVVTELKRRASQVDLAKADQTVRQRASQTPASESD